MSDIIEQLEYILKHFSDNTPTDTLLLYLTKLHASKSSFVDTDGVLQQYISDLKTIVQNSHFVTSEEWEKACAITKRTVQLGYFNWSDYSCIRRITDNDSFDLIEIDEINSIENRVKFIYLVNTLEKELTRRYFDSGDITVACLPDNRFGSQIRHSSRDYQHNAWLKAKFPYTIETLQSNCKIYRDPIWVKGKVLNVVRPDSLSNDGKVIIGYIELDSEIITADDIYDCSNRIPIEAHISLEEYNQITQSPVKALLFSLNAFRNHPRIRF
jgi:hypothetical protein